MNHLTTTSEFFFCIYVRGKEGNTTNPTIFLPFHFVKDKMLGTLFCWEIPSCYLHRLLVVPPISTQRPIYNKELEMRRKSFELTTPTRAESWSQTTSYTPFFSILHQKVRMRITLVNIVDASKIAFKQPRVQFPAFSKKIISVIFLCCCNFFIGLLTVKWTEAWKCQRNPSGTGSLLNQKHSGSFVPSSPVAIWMTSIGVR